MEVWVYFTEGTSSFLEQRYLVGHTISGRKPLPRDFRIFADTHDITRAVARMPENVRTLAETREYIEKRRSRCQRVCCCGRVK
jgi:hypothetical protein